MSALASQITSVSIIYSTVCSGTDLREHQSSASQAFVRGIHRWPVNSPHKGPVTQKMFPLDHDFGEHAPLSTALRSTHHIRYLIWQVWHERAGSMFQNGYSMLFQKRKPRAPEKERNMPRKGDATCSTNASKWKRIMVQSGNTAWINNHICIKL